MFTLIPLAYIDPGSGSLIVQVLIAGALGLLLGIKVFWNNIIGAFKGRKPPTDGTTSDS